jgi:hypothetical protein
MSFIGIDLGTSFIKGAAEDDQAGANRQSRKSDLKEVAAICISNPQLVSCYPLWVNSVLRMPTGMRRVASSQAARASERLGTVLFWRKATTSSSLS